MTFPLTTLAPAVTPAGITAPTFADILTSLKASLQIIYGQDLYLGADTQDGQLVAIFAQAMSDGNSAIIDAFNSFRPTVAQGVPLSSIVKINGISRNVPSASQVDLLIGGTVGTVIVNGVAGDANGNAWNLPASVTVPPGGSIIVTATCSVDGEVAAVPGSINIINTPTLGWSTVDNPSSASLGAPVESDSALRLRQAQSVALPAMTELASTLAAVKQLTGVVEAVIYENDTNVTDADGLPPHSIALVVSGGDATEIATAISIKKTPGCYTYGTTAVVVVDGAGVAHTIRFFVPTDVPIGVSVTIKALAGYTGATGIAIKQAIADYINDTLGIGQDVVIARLYLPAQLNGGPGSEQFDLQQLLVSILPAPPGPTDLVIAFNAQATCAVADISLTVV